MKKIHGKPSGSANPAEKQPGMKRFEVTLFVLGLPPALQNYRTEEVLAPTQAEAEQEAHDRWFPDGWGVYDSKEIE